MARPKSNQQRRQYGLRLESAIMRELEHLAVDEQKWLNELVEEAVKDLLRKYKDKRRG